MPDGKYEFEIGGRRAVVEVYAAGGKRFFDSFLDGNLLNEEVPVRDRETDAQLLERIRAAV
jgi:hypothetical protein